MTGIQTWSTTASENVNANIGYTWDEGMPPAAVNNSARSTLADIRTAFNDLAWFSYAIGSKPVAYTYASSTSVTVTGADSTTAHHAGRRMKFTGSSTGTIYGTISSSSYNSGSSTVTINLTFDSGSLSNETLTGYLSQIPLTGGVLPAFTQTGLKVQGGDSHTLTIKPNETMTAARTLSIVTGDASRSLTFTADTTVGGTHSGTSSGTNTGDQTITLTGDVTGSGTGSFAATIGSNKVTNAKMATMADQTLKGNVSGGSAAPSDLTKTQTQTFLGMSSYKTATSAVNLGTNYSEAHGLGNVPSVFSLQVFLKCTTTNLGYAVGDLVPVSPIADSGTERGVTAFVNNTNVGFTTAASSINIGRKDTGAQGDITTSSWNIFAVLVYGS